MAVDVRGVMGKKNSMKIGTTCLKMHRMQTGKAEASCPKFHSQLQLVLSTGAQPVSEELDKTEPMPHVCFKQFLFSSPLIPTGLEGGFL